MVAIDPTINGSSTIIYKQEELNSSRIRMMSIISLLTQWPSFPAVSYVCKYKPIGELSAFSIDSLGFVGDIGLLSDVPMSLLAVSGRLRYLRQYLYFPKLGTIARQKT